MPKLHKKPRSKFLGQSHALVRGSCLDTKPGNPTNFVACIRRTSPHLSNWLCRGRTYSFSLLAIITINTPPQFPPNFHHRICGRPHRTTKSTHFLLEIVILK
jgi:hypothetical protein